MADGGPTYRGPLPRTDEPIERLINACLLWVDSVKKGFLRIVQYDSSGSEVVFPALGSSIVTGTKTVTIAGTAVQVNAASVPIKGVWINADLIQGSVMTVGDASVVGNASGMRGIILTPGNPPIFLGITNINLIWVDSQINGGKLAFAYISA